MSAVLAAMFFLFSLQLTYGLWRISRRLESIDRRLDKWFHGMAAIGKAQASEEKETRQ